MAIASGHYTKENFEIHCGENPHIYQLFCDFALQAAARREYYSAKIIFHRIRWETEITEQRSDFKVSDGWISHYSRKFMSDYPQHDGFFKLVQRQVSYHDDATPAAAAAAMQGVTFTGGAVI